MWCSGVSTIVKCGFHCVAIECHGVSVVASSDALDDCCGGIVVSWNAHVLSRCVLLFPNCMCILYGDGTKRSTIYFIFFWFFWFILVGKTWSLSPLCKGNLDVSVIWWVTVTEGWRRYCNVRMGLRLRHRHSCNTSTIIFSPCRTVCFDGHRVANNYMHI